MRFFGGRDRHEQERQSAVFPPEPMNGNPQPPSYPPEVQQPTPVPVSQVGPANIPISSGAPSPVAPDISKEIDELRRITNDLRAAAQTSQGALNAYGNMVQGIVTQLNVVQPNVVQPAPEAPGEDHEPQGDSETVLDIHKDVKALLESMRQLEGYDETKERLFKGVHDELVKLRAGIRHDLLRDVLLQLAQTLNELLRQINGLPDPSDPGYGAKANRLFHDMYEMYFADLLEGYDAESYASEPGQPFDRTRQKVFRVEPTQDAKCDGTIMRSLAAGYLFDGKLLIKEQVIVWKYEAPVETDAPNATPTKTPDIDTDAPAPVQDDSPSHTDGDGEGRKPAPADAGTAD